ncbi:DUF3313 family protein [Gilvimarinus sp. DA14]|uniref:DUF3313 family protein n=1 Tax=Gilvimarinus sp. DA14 TaxID=2956798 RepID=UPI0020B6D9F9|nr:DUF3313 family protein [Gilvimarinus sp. DA14]UTF61479.1 DUF3313 domain-containing protein [Gilvimarinus sp. DA14]
MRTLSLALLCTFVFTAGCATPPPPVSHDGLHLIDNRDLDQVYLKPEIDLGAYGAISLRPCTVAFRDNWQRNQNSNISAGRARVTDEDMDVIKGRLAEACDKYFRQALEKEPAYRIVAEGEQSDVRVLDVRPSIIDLDVTAPDLNDVGMVTTYTTDSGEMTLFLEAYDGATGEILARVVDRKRDRDDMYLEWTNRATNMHDANMYLRSWTNDLREGLDKARAL